MFTNSDFSHARKCFGIAS